MDHEQLEQIILDAYDARAEIKEYFEFFLNPDVGKLLEKHKARLVKELNRTRWGRSKARVTIIKRAVKDFMGFAPGAEAEFDMLFQTLDLLGTAERYVDFTPQLMRYVEFLARQIVAHADDRGVFSDIKPRLDAAIVNPNYSNYFRRTLREALEG